MSFHFISPSAKAAWVASTDQESQLLGLAAAWSGEPMVLRYYSAADVLLDTVLHGAPAINYSTTPLQLEPGAITVRTFAAAGIAAYVIAAVPAGADILRATVAMGAAVFSAARTSLVPQSGAAGLVVRADSGLPLGVATTLTLSMPSTGTAGVAVTVTATPNGPVVGGGTATLATDVGTLGTTTLTWTAGESAAKTTTLTLAIAGTASVTLTTGTGLSIIGSPAGFTAAAYIPAWLTAAVGEWAQISGTAAPAELGDYCGVGVREDGTGVEIFSGAAGGHGGNLTNNRVRTLQIITDAPAWVERRAASDATGTTTGAYMVSDGRPVPRHLYYNVAWVPELARYMAGGRFWWSAAADYLKHDGFNPASGVDDWDASGTYADDTGAYGKGVRDPATGIWYSTLATGRKWTPATDTWSAWGLSGATVNRDALAFDSLRGQVYHLSAGDNFSSNSSAIRSAKISTAGVAASVGFNASAAWTEFQANAANFRSVAISYNADDDVFYFYAGDATTGTQKVYVITPNASATWDMAVMTVSGVTPATSSTGVLNKFFYSSALRCCVLVVAGQSVYYVRVA